MLLLVKEHDCFIEHSSYSTRNQQVPKLHPFDYKHDNDMDGPHSTQSIEAETSLVQLPFQAARNNPDSQLE